MKKNILFMILCLMLFGVAEGTITGITILDSEFMAGGYSGSHQIVDWDSTYAEVSYPDDPQRTPTFSTQTGFFNNSIVYNTMVSGYVAVAQGQGEVVFSPLASTLTITLEDTESVGYIYGEIRLKDNMTERTVFLFKDIDVFSSFTYTWQPILSHQYTLSYSGVASIESSTYDSRMASVNINIIPEPTTLCFLALGAVLLKRKK